MMKCETTGLWYWLTPGICMQMLLILFLLLLYTGAPFTQNASLLVGYWNTHSGRCFRYFSLSVTGLGLGCTAVKVRPVSPASCASLRPAARLVDALQDCPILHLASHCLSDRMRTPVPGDRMRNRVRGKRCKVGNRIRRKGNLNVLLLEAKME